MFYTAALRRNSLPRVQTRGVLRAGHDVGGYLLPFLDNGPGNVTTFKILFTGDAVDKWLPPSTISGTYPAASSRFSSLAARSNHALFRRAFVTQRAAHGPHFFMVELAAQLP